MTPERWSAADRYEGYMGRWSRLVAAQFLAWLAPARGLAWLDSGCGTGALLHEIVAQAGPRRVVALDRSAAYVAAARERHAGARGAFMVADAQALPIASRSLDIAVSALVLNFVPEPARMVEELARVVTPGGGVAVYVWDYAGGMQLLRHFWDAAAALDPGAARLDEAARFPLCEPEPLRRLFENCGMQRVEVRAIDVSTRFRDFGDFWAPFLGGQGPAPGYVAGLDAAGRRALEELLRARLPASADGGIALGARAWAVQGRT